MDNQDLLNRIQALETQMREHAHDGFHGGEVFIKNLWGAFEVVSVAPTSTPNTMYEQIKIYVNGVTYRLYWYDTVGGAWHYVTATA